MISGVSIADSLIFLSYFFDLFVECKLCQMGNELTQVSDPNVRELVINVQKASPCGQACMNDVRISPDYSGPGAA